MASYKTYRHARAFVAALIAFALAFAPYHAHTAIGAAEGATGVYQTSSNGDHGSDSSGNFETPCNGCSLMKHVQAPGRSPGFLSRPLEANAAALVPSDAGVCPRSAIRDVFRPPIQLLA